MHTAHGLRSWPCDTLRRGSGDDIVTRKVSVSFHRAVPPCHLGRDAPHMPSLCPLASFASAWAFHSWLFAGFDSMNSSTESTIYVVSRYVREYRGCRAGAV